MSTKLKNTPFASTEEKFGITEKKKAELDELQINLIETQHIVDQESAIVASLSTKLTKLEGFLAVAESNKVQALSHRNLVDEVITNAENLKSNSKIAFDEMVSTNEKMETVSSEMKGLIDKLIYSAEIINKLSNLIIRKKAQNPLISDELVAMVGTAGTDANNAVALTLTALKSAFAALSSSVESEASTALQYNQAVDLHKALTGEEEASSGKEDNQQDKCIRDLLYEAYNHAQDEYDTFHQACMDTTKQLNSAKSKLDKAQVRLSSYQSGMAAAQAAALSA
ncbi:hypothetical protein [Reichenbachiella sp.]|uniref:hypothetical protein n=1 Tax=Reichenbachiella sp. TaxID=2184521 RepID=UPI003BAF397B